MFWSSQYFINNNLHTMRRNQASSVDCTTVLNRLHVTVYRDYLAKFSHNNVNKLSALGF